jgi:phosphate transport system protein
MRNRFDRQLEQLNNELIQMGSMIEHAIEMAVSALVNQDTEKAKKAMAYDV